MTLFKKICFFSIIFAVFLTLFAGKIFSQNISESQKYDFESFDTGKGSFSLKFSRMNSSEFYNSSGDKLKSSDPSFPGGLRQDYSEILFLLGFSYCFIDGLKFYFDFPIRSRQETSSLGGEKTGIGDLSISAEYLFLKSINASVLTSLKLPSGSTNLSYKQEDLLPYEKLPLGTGQTDFHIGLKIRQILSFAKFSQTAKYRFRFAGTPSYMQNEQVTFTDTQTATSQAYPLGNRKIDFGDEVEFFFDAEFFFLKKFSLGLSGLYTFGRTTIVTVSSVNTDDIQSFKAGIPSYHYFKLSPIGRFYAKRNLSVFFEVDLPVAGKNYPVIPAVNSLVGITYCAGINLSY